MNDIKMIYKYNIEDGHKNIATTLTSDDPNNLLLIPELLEENKKKVEDYYNNLEFRKIVTYSSERGFSYIIYTFINGTLDTLVDSGKSSYICFPSVSSPELGPKTKTVITHVTPGYSDKEEYENALKIYDKYKFTKWGFLVSKPTFNPHGGKKYYETAPIKPYDEKKEFCKHYELIEPLEFHDGLAKSRKVFYSGKVRYGFIDTKGNVVVDYKYDDVMPFCDGLAKVEKNLKFGFVNVKGQEVIPCIYAAVGEFHDGLVVVKKDGKYGYVDKFGNEVIPCQYDYADNFYNGLARVAYRKATYSANVGCIDKKGRIVIPCIYDNLKIVIPTIFDIYDHRKNVTYSSTEYIKNKILEIQKYIEKHTNPNFDTPDYNQFMMRLRKYEEMKSLQQPVQQHFIDIMADIYGKIECFCLTYPYLSQVISVEKQLKITYDDNETFYLDVEGAEQLKKVLTKNKY